MKQTLLIAIVSLWLYIPLPPVHAEPPEPPPTMGNLSTDNSRKIADYDQVILKNGDRITGEIISMEENKLKVKTFYAGEITVNWNDVESVVSQSPLIIEVFEENNPSNDVEFLKTTRVTVNNISDKEGYSLAEIERINISEYRYAGNIDLGGNRTTGNTDTTAFNASAEATIRTTRHRVDLAGKYAFSHADGKNTANNARGTLRYDYFLTKKLFLTGNEFLEQDQLQELDLRSTTGIGAGYQFYDSSEHQLSGYLGPAFVFEQFRQSVATKTSTLTWVLEWEFDLLTDHLRAFHKQLGARDFAGDRTNALRWIAEQGVRIQLYHDLYLKLAYDFRFNSDPEPGRKKSDQAFIWGIGYQFSN